MVDSGKDFISPVPGVPYQDCWIGRSGRPLDQQLKDYSKTFAPWDEKVSINLDPQNEIKIIDMTYGDLTNSKTIKDLQEHLIVLNGNEFRLRDKPTGDEFEEILSDFGKWHLRGQAKHFIGGEEGRSKVSTRIDETLEFARNKFIEINKV